jgi:ABC-type antimicrobial peptide transport system ATPase subunit
MSVSQKHYHIFYVVFGTQRRMIFATCKTEFQRRNQVTRALNVTKNTSLTPGAYERQLLEQFVQGSLPIRKLLP